MWLDPSGGLVTFTAYDKAADYPGRLVVRRWVILGASLRPDLWPAIVTSHEDFPAVAHFMEVILGLYWLDRQEHDDPAIVGTWI